MSQKIIIPLAIIGVSLIVITVAINKATEILKDHTNIAWFILGFGSCIVIEAIIWWIIRFIRRRFP
jgi:hypothetical protein